MHQICIYSLCFFIITAVPRYNAVHLSRPRSFTDFFSAILHAFFFFFFFFFTAHCVLRPDCTCSVTICLRLRLYHICVFFATGNTILRRKAFLSKLSFSAVTGIGKKEKGEFDGQSLAVIDTPSLFPTTNPKDEVLKEVIRCISLAAPGPHVFLVVLQLGRFTPEEQKTVEIIQGIFGEKAEGYTMVLFTHGEDLEAEGGSVEEIIDENQNLKQFIQKCHGGYHVFNNGSEDPSQVAELLQKIKKMVQRNGGSHYTNEMLQEAEAAITEEMVRLMRNDPNLTLEEARKKAEENYSFMKKWLSSVLVIVCSYKELFGQCFDVPFHKYTFHKWVCVVIYFLNHVYHHEEFTR
uniref:AIG1-type G domain-containing protein n=1 Tax=Myripristis murdjan TaxID=586833 RepID=A0A667W9Q4_9TELE